MALLKVTSPHVRKPTKTADIMRTVIVATLPGIAVLTYYFGWGTLINIVWASFVALGCEALILKMRKRPIAFYLKDYSALLTAVLLGIALPPHAPWWLTFMSVGTAIVIAKQLYGGLGFNPFNPAMVGYVVVLISFPTEMSQWAAPRGVLAEHDPLAFFDSLALTFGFAKETVDAFTMATPLDVFKQNSALMVSDLWAKEPVFGRYGGSGWEYANFAFLLGGLYLLYKKIYTWHAPLSMLISLTFISAVFYEGGSSASGGSPLFHIFSGATLFGAFFIVTDPVTSAVSNRGRIVYGACIGVLVYLIRVWGNYPDAVAFSVLLMNFCAPFIDYYTQPRSFGHENAGHRSAGHSSAGHNKSGHGSSAPVNPDHSTEKYATEHED